MVKKDVFRDNNISELNDLSAHVNSKYFVNRNFSIYVHIPFCKYRCGYCDFNTYTNTNFGVGASLDDYVQSLCLEYDLSLDIFEKENFDLPDVSTVFFGGGTPTFLKSDNLALAVEQLRKRFVFKDVEITTEANPETVDENYLRDLASAGFTRVSFGAQSGVKSVLNILDRKHDPEKLAQLVDCAKGLGMQTSVDLIYATPGESVDDWIASLEYAVGLKSDHISAYALMIHDGTKMGQDLKHGKIKPVNNDDEAVKYKIADEFLYNCGFRWYEISNWAKNGKVCKHNIAYWKSDNWWGYGAGAHSYVNATRWANTKHPRNYAMYLREGVLPVCMKDILDSQTICQEKIMLELRLREGIALDNSYFYFTDEKLDILRENGYLLEREFNCGRLVLSLRGRLMADYITQILWDGFRVI